jgi:hypothetical protein
MLSEDTRSKPLLRLTILAVVSVMLQGSASAPAMERYVAARTPGPMIAAATAGAATITEPGVERAISSWRRGARQSRTVVVLDSTVEAGIARLRAASPTFEEAWAQLETRKVPVLIGTREQLEDILPSNLRRGRGWAGLTVNWGYDDTLTRSVVALRMEWLRGVHGFPADGEAGSGSFDAALEKLLIHEVYGHLAPVVKTRNLRYHCADPRPGERHEESCVGQREQLILAEIEQGFESNLAASGAGVEPSEAGSAGPPSPTAGAYEEAPAGPEGSGGASSRLRRFWRAIPGVSRV